MSDVLGGSEKLPSRLNGRMDVVDVGEVLAILARLEGLTVPELSVPYLEFVALAFEGDILLRIRLCGPVLEDFGVTDPALLNGRDPGDAICDSAELLLTRLIDLGRALPGIDCVILYIDM